jgi:Protein of unknown function (DUF2911)
MNKLLKLALMSSILFSATIVMAQDKSTRKSPPAKVSQTLKSGATISIDYSQPSLNGRVIGTDVEPKSGKVWRMGANEATVFETDKEVKIEGKELPAGKYSLFGLKEDDGFTLIFNKNWKIWGTAYDSNKDQDALRVKVKAKKADSSKELLTYTIEKDGEVTLHWGDMEVEFEVK